MGTFIWKNLNYKHSAAVGLFAGS